MRRGIATLALGLCLAGCDSLPPPIEPFDLVTSWEPGSAEAPGCRPGWWAAGRLIVDPNRGTAMIVESGDYRGPKGVPMPVLWWPTFTGRRLENEVVVLDPNGNVVVRTGRRYRIEGSFEPVGFVACGFTMTMPRELGDDAAPP